MKASTESRRAGMPVRLLLYVADHRASSLIAVGNAERLCKEQLGGRCRLEVVDIEEEPRRAVKEQIVAILTLARRFARPEKRVIGDLSKTERVIAGLALEPYVGCGFGRRSPRMRDQ
jgi:circadian clock protein KaiB